MPKRSRKEEDVNVTAFDIVKATTEKPTQEPIKEKNPAAVALGRLGGKKGGKARAEKLSSKRRSDIAKKAAITRWAKRHT